MNDVSSGENFLQMIRFGLPRSCDGTSPLLVGVSGGADSLALLIGLQGLATTEPLELVVVHAEHDLRSEAVTDREFVSDMAKRLGLPVYWRRLPVSVAGDGVEAAAREARYRYFAEVAGVIGARHVAVAHTADDQAETILHRLLRGTGLTGLAGMPRARELATGIALIRPLLAVRRQQVRDFLRGRGACWLEDSTNADVRYARNFIRHELIARAEDGPYPAATAAVIRLGGQAARYSAALEDAAGEMLETASSSLGSHVVVLRPGGLVRRDPLLLAEMFTLLWRRQGWSRQAMTAAHYERLVDFIRDEDPSSCDLPGGIRVQREPDGLVRISRAEKSPLGSQAGGPEPRVRPLPVRGSHP
jgi:tRNA(Ile)-lysidine synthase